MAEPFEAVYTDAQREAMAEAYEDHGIRPAAKVAVLAEAGKLPAGLEPFEVKGGAATVRDCARKLRNRRAGRLASETAKRPPRDAIESLRIRLLSAIDHELAQVEGDQRKRGKDAKPVDPERLRQLARALREAAAIPERTDPTPPKPGHGPKAERVGGQTRGTTTLGGQILADANREGETAHDLPLHASDGGESVPDGGGNHGLPGAETDGSERSPGAWVREQISPLVSVDPADT